MARVQRANVILNIDEKDVDHYMANGYNLIDDRGNIVKETMPNDVPTLQARYRASLSKINELQAQINELKAELETKKSTRTSSSKTAKSAKADE